MSIKPSSLLKLSVAGAVLLSVGACKAADKGQGALKSQGVSALNLSKSQANVFSKYFATEACEVDEMEALGALAGLGMGENGTNGVSYDSRTVTAGLVTYKNLALKADGSEQTAFSAGSAVFHCPQMGDESPIFSRLDLSNVFIKNEKDDVEFTAKTLNIANPSADAAQAIVGNIVQPNSRLNPDVGFGAISITGVNIKSGEMNGTMDALSWGETRNEKGQGKADLTVNNINVVIAGENNKKDITLDFGGMSARNLHIGGSVDNKLGKSSSEMVSTMLGSLNVFEKPYDELIVEPLKVNAEDFTVNFGGIEGKTTEKGKVITTRQSLKPTEINFNPSFGNQPQFKQQYELMKSLGMDSIKLSGSSVSTLDGNDDSVSVSDGLFVVDDVFRLNFEYEAEGLSAMVQKLQSLENTPSNADALGVYEALKLRNFRLTLEDNSIVDKGLTLATQMTGQSEQGIKLMLTGAVFFAASQAKNEIQADVYSKSMEAFSDFVKKGGTLTLEANPPQPFSFAPFFTGDADEIDPINLGFSASQE